VCNTADFAQEEEEANKTWTCPTCTYQNAPLIFSCGMCAQEKAVEVPDYLDQKHPFWKKKEEIVVDGECIHYLRSCEYRMCI